MRALKFEHRSEFPVPVRELWAFHTHEAALDVLAPPLSGFRVVDRGDGVADGAVMTAEVGFGPLHQRWRALHYGVEEGRAFTDVALESPFPYWVHHHRMEELGRQRSALVDTLRFVPPRGLRSPLARPLLTAALRLFFGWRHRATLRWLKAHGRPRHAAARACRSFAQEGCS